MNKRYLLLISFALFLILSSFSLNAQTIIWSENFTYPDGTAQGSGTPPKWTVDVTNCTLDGDDHFEVRSNQMEGNDLDGEAVWTSENIDISGCAIVSVTVNLSEVGDLEGTDYIRVYYKIDGGAETLFDVNGDNSDDFDNLVASQTNLSGNSLTIVIRVMNNSTTEFIRFDDVIVREGALTLDHFAIDPISNQKVGVPFPITVTAKDASDATVITFTGAVDISDLSGNIAPTTSGNFTAGVWTGNVTISSEHTSDQITVTNNAGTETGTSNQFDVVTGPAPGSVVINELMWTGSTLSSADEWIELRNTTSSDIDLSGWQLTKLSGGAETFMLEIPAGSTIPANGYFLISNYDEANSQIAVTPDLVDASVSLANTQLQIKLYDGQWDGGGTLIDTADDGVGDPAAGDNTNKYSMMRTDPPGDGTLAANWFTANLAAGWDAGATEMGTPGTSNFALEVTSHSPDKNELNVLASSNIVVQFSLDIDASTINENSFNVDGSYSGEITDSYTVNGNTVTFDPANNFKPGEVVTATLTTNVRSSSGVALGEPYFFQFFVKSEATCGIFSDSGQNLGTFNSADVALGDLDSDGDLDAFVANSDETQPNKVWLNDGKGNFTDSGQSLGTSTSFAVCLGDFDGDNDLDAFVTNSDNPEQIWINDGSGNFSDNGQSINILDAYRPSAGDVDGDGDLDVFVATANGSDKLLLNDGTGQFTDSGQIFHAGGSMCADIELGDLDNDGDLDAFFVMMWRVPNEVWFNDGNGNFTNSGQSLGDGSSWRASLADVDADGDLDAFVVNGENVAANSINKVWLNDASGNFTDSGQSLGTDPSHGLFMGDIDGDGDVDAFVANLGSSVPAPVPNKIWLNDGSGNFVDSGQNIGESYSNAVSLGDIDNDGDLDAFVANINSMADKVWLNCIDFADLPSSYNLTTLADDGARHNVGNLFLGAAVDGEADGQESADAGRAAADGDDGNPAGGTDDEDGITVNGEWHDGTNGGAIDVTVTGGSGFLSGWIDWDENNDFTDAGNQILNMKPVVAGTQTIQFDIPDGAIPAEGAYNRFARFRLVADNSTPLTLTGLFQNGEVEDYYLQFTGNLLDSDNDGIADITEGSGDRDGDGIADNLDYDPSGWIYDESNGNLISGGTISISPSAGVNIIQDGNNGYYQFTVSQNGDYTLSYTPPAGFNLSSSCTAQSGTLDISPSDPNPYVVGAGSKDGSTNKMTNWNCGDNPYYWDFHLEVGDPIIINNNIPLQQTSPEIDVQRPAGTSIVDGGTDDVGNQNIGTVNLTYTIDNSAGTAQLDVTAVTATNLVNCSNFSVVTSLPLNIAAGNTATLQISFDVDAAGAFSFDMDIANNDDNENPYDIQVTGNGTQPTNVVLSSFDVSVNSNGVLLQWTTASEPDNAGFNIFRSQLENGDYAKINESMIPAQGNATSGASYSYLDTPTQMGTYYYKLQSVSLTGDTSFHGPVSVILTAVDIKKYIVPNNYSLTQNYPNPFNPKTIIEYALPEPAQVTLAIYDINGHLVQTLISGQQTAGVHLVKWDSRDNNGIKVVSAVYFYYFKAKGVSQSFVQTKKMILMK